MASADSVLMPPPPAPSSIAAFPTEPPVTSSQGLELETEPKQSIDPRLHFFQTLDILDDAALAASFLCKPTAGGNCSNTDFQHSLPSVGSLNTAAFTSSSQSALTRAAQLFSSVACRQLGLSPVDPVQTAFASGCRVLPRLHSLQRAIACLSKYSSSDADMLPVS
ncbi:unnamed protein product [Protopolystoma xenopodis]|uniref:Uncharacterized protein n=1 Tax=Protopolystoma xenopodis TaxID=117903 RepID=A0A3S5ASG5_9PLAT|nr:unnamed protein product [Protopolystoma xenopodis]